MATPRDMPRRTSTAPPPAATQPPPDRWDRAAFAAGIRGSDLHSCARLVALTLAGLADENGRVTEARMPGLLDLAAATGLTISRARISLRNLTRGGWAWTYESPNSTQFGAIRLTLPRSRAARLLSA